MRRHYTEPLARADLVAAGDWLADRWRRREAVADLPVLLTWGMEDAVLGDPALGRFEDLFRDARVERFEDVGHYVPEEAGERFVDRVEAFLEKAR